MNARAFTGWRWYAKPGVSQMVSEDTTVWSAPSQNADGSRWFVFADADDHGDNGATANLIAAAPDGYTLAEAIEQLESSPLQRDYVPPEIQSLARAFLAKARGEQP